MISAAGWRHSLGAGCIQTALALLFCGVLFAHAHAQQTAAPQTAPAATSAPSPSDQAPASPAPQGAEPAPAEPATPPPPVLSAAEQQEIADIQRPVADLKDKLDRLEKTVERNLENEEELQRLRG